MTSPAIPLVLIVDDEPHIVSAFSDILEHEGYATVTAHSGEQALRLVQSGVRPSAILLDLRMPGMGGLGLLLWLRAHPEGADIPVAVVTADTHLDDTTERAVTGLDAVLRFKPMTIRDVLELTRTLLRHVTPASPEAWQPGDRRARAVRQAPAARRPPDVRAPQR